MQQQCHWSREMWYVEKLRLKKFVSRAIASDALMELVCACTCQTPTPRRLMTRLGRTTLQYPCADVTDSRYLADSADTAKNQYSRTLTRTRTAGLPPQPAKQAVLETPSTSHTNHEHRPVFAKAVTLTAEQLCTPGRLVLPMN